MKHDHRQSLWIIASGKLLWCYRCGAWRVNDIDGVWHRPTGLDGANPAMKENYIWTKSPTARLRQGDEMTRMTKAERQNRIKDRMANESRRKNR